MTIQEAIKSEKLVRKSNGYQWCYFVEKKIWRGSTLDRQLFLIGSEDATEFPISKSDILATDWQLKD